MGHFAAAAREALDLRLYLVSDPLLTLGRSLLSIVEQSLQGGVTLVQLRDKRASDREFFETAKRLKAVSVRYQVPLLLNDRVEIAREVGADGVHLGDQDMSPAEARLLLGPGKIIGASAGTLEEARSAQAAGADYLGIGPVFETSTKGDAGAALGVDGLRDICQSVSIPSVAIGSINANNIDRVLRSGVSGVAVVSALTLAEDVSQAAQDLLAAYGRTE